MVSINRDRNSIEQDIEAYIFACPDGDFEKVLNSDDRLEVFFHLSRMRESILNWYPFEPNASLLEYGGNMGALTGLFCTRCAEVTSIELNPFRAEILRQRYKKCDNLTVLDTSEYTCNEKFDYIVALDYADLSVEGFNRLREQLKPQGRLLVAMENRFGLRNWCGKRSRQTGKPFDTVSGRDGSFGKAQISLNLERAGFGGQKWYYPMSDHWFTQDIYSDKYIPESYSTARFRPYVEPDYTLLMNEQELYKDVFQNHVFEFFSNAYLVEARLDAEDKPCPVDFAAVTTYRTKEKRFATIICDNVVKKMPLHPDGEKGINRMIYNHELLAKRGINVLPLSLDGDSVVMPRIRQETLIDYWQRTLQDGSFDFDAFVNMFDRFQSVIFQSSEMLPPGTGGCDPMLGEVQKLAFPELVPANCFYDHEKDVLLFFDQEFSIENYPVKIVLARLLQSIVFSDLGRESRLLEAFDELKVRLGLEDCWEAVDKAAVDFLEQIFSFDSYRQLVKLQEVDDRKIERSVKVSTEALKEAEIEQVIVSVLSESDTKNIVLYGYGARGRYLHTLLRGSELTVLFAIDKNASRMVGTSIKIYCDLESLECIDKPDLIIVTPFSDADTIAKDLRRETTCKVITLNDIFETLNATILTN